MTYGYSNGDKISVPNTYFYTEYQGSEFIESFYENRRMILKLGQKAEKPNFCLDKNKILKPQNIQTSVLLYDLYSELIDREYETQKIDFSIIDLMLRKFEVSKKIYDSYQYDLTNILSANFRTYILYINFASILNKSYLWTMNLSYLNGLLKLTDSIISVSDDLSKTEMKNLSWLIKEEIGHIESLHKKLQIVDQ
jgi:hypothetical protein